MFLVAFGAEAVGEVGIGAAADIGFQALPFPLGVADFVAKGTHGQKPMQRLDMIQGGLQFGDEFFPLGQRDFEGMFLDFQFRDVAADADEADDLPGFVAQRDFGGENLRPPTLLVGVRLIFVDERLAPENLVLVGPKRFAVMFRIKIFIPFSEQIVREFTPHVAGHPVIGHQETPVKILHINIIRQVVNEGAQQIPFVKQRLLGALAVGDVNDRGDHEHAFVGLDRAQADLNGNLRSVLAHTMQIRPRSHRPRGEIMVETPAQFRMLFPKPFGNQQLQLFPQQLRAGIAEKLFGLGVHQDNVPFGIRHDQGIGTGLDEQRHFCFD